MLSRTAIHALKAVALLAEEPHGFQGAVRIAERIGAPQNYLGKLLQTLTQSGILISQKGMGGGFQLNRPASDITLFDVVEPIDRVSRWSDCFMRNGSCTPEKPCSMHSRWASIRELYLRMLKESTIQDIAGR